MPRTAPVTQRENVLVLMPPVLFDAHKANRLEWPAAPSPDNPATWPTLDDLAKEVQRRDLHPRRDRRDGAGTLRVERVGNQLRIHPTDAAQYLRDLGADDQSAAGKEAMIGFPEAIRQYGIIADLSHNAARAELRRAIEAGEITVHGKALTLNTFIEWAVPHALLHMRSATPAAVAVA